MSIFTDALDTIVSPIVSLGKYVKDKVVPSLGFSDPTDITVDPSQYDLGQEGFNNNEDQASFAYLEALDKSAAQYNPSAIRDISPVQAAALRDPTIGPISATDASGPAAIERYQAAQVAAPAPVTASGPAASYGYQALGVAAPNSIVAPTIAATDIGPAATATFGGVGATSLDTSQGDQIRSGQLGDIQALRDTAAGNGPSAALDDYSVALDQARDSVLGQVNQGHGTDKAAAQYQAMLNLGAQGITAARAASAERAKEMQDAATAVVGATASARGTDVAEATTQATLDQQSATVAAQLATAVAQGNRDAINTLTAQKASIDAQRAQAQASNQLAASTSNASNQLGAATTTAQLGSQAASQLAATQSAAALDYQKRLDEAATTSAANQLAAGTTNANLETGANAGNAASYDAAMLDYQKRQDAAAAATAAAQNKANTDQATLREQSDVAGGQQSLEAQEKTNEQGVARDVDANNAGQGAFTATQNAQQGALGKAIDATGAATTATKGLTDATQQQYDLALKDKQAQMTAAAANNQAKLTAITGLIPKV